MSSREWEQMHRKSVSQTGGWYVELEEDFVYRRFMHRETRTAAVYNTKWRTDQH